MTIYTNQALFKGVNKRAQVVPNLYTNKTSLKGEKKEAWNVPKLSVYFNHHVSVVESLTIPDAVDIIRITTILDITSEDYGCILFIQLHHVADSVGLFACHHCGARSSECINDDSISLTGVLDRISKKIQRLGGRMVLVSLWLVEVPDGSLFPVGIPWMVAVL